MRKSKFVQVTVLVVCLILLTGMLALALGENGRFAIVGGGGQLEAQGIRLNTAIGHPVAGRVSNDEAGLVLCSGFGCGAGTAVLPEGDYSVYLPTLIKARQ